MSDNYPSPDDYDFTPEERAYYKAWFEPLFKRGETVGTLHHAVMVSGGFSEDPKDGITRKDFAGARMVEDEMLGNNRFDKAFKAGFDSVPIYRKRG